jgi:hypothetical protein
MQPKAVYGISKEGNLLDIAVIEEFVQKGGAWFSYKDARLGQDILIISLQEIR